MSRARTCAISAALALLLREHLTGRPIPDSARAGVDMLRGWIEERAGGDFAALADSIEDQRAFQALSLDMLQHLELTRVEPQDSQPDDADDMDGDEETEEDESGDSADEKRAGHGSLPGLFARPSPIAAAPTTPTPDAWMDTPS